MCSHILILKLFITVIQASTIQNFTEILLTMLKITRILGKSFMGLHDSAGGSLPSWWWEKIYLSFVEKNVLFADRRFVWYLLQFFVVSISSSKQNQIPFCTLQKTDCIALPHMMLASYIFHIYKQKTNIKLWKHWHPERPEYCAELPKHWYPKRQKTGQLPKHWYTKIHRKCCVTKPWMPKNTEKLQCYKNMNTQNT